MGTALKDERQCLQRISLKMSWELKKFILNSRKFYILKWKWCMCLNESQIYKRKSNININIGIQQIISNKQNL